MAEKDEILGISGKPESWISRPSRYIVVHEPPATPFYSGAWAYHFWHEARGPAVILMPSNIRDRFISPVLFVDGHAVRQDSTREITLSYQYPAEPMPDWYFYEPAAGGP